MLKLAPRLRLALTRRREDESGSIILFTLFVLVLMLIVSGMAIDFLRFTSQSARLQDTADRAAVAATKLTNNLDPRDVVNSHFEAVGLEDRIVDIRVEDTGDYRRVSIDYDFGVNTFFLRLAGMDQLEGQNTSIAVQGVANVEVSVVLDISASMYGSKIDTLRVEAEKFVQSVLDPAYEGTVSLNVIPFAGDLDIGQVMFDYLEGVRYIDGVPLADRSIDNIATADPNDTIPYPFDLSFCLKQSRSSLSSLDLPATGLPQVEHFHPHSAAINNNAPWFCPVGAPVQYAVQDAGLATDPTSLSYFVKNIPMATGTNSATALNYGAALLNPSSRSAFNHLNDQGVIPDDFRGRPADYDDPGVQKILIFMSDGNPWQVGYPNDPFDGWLLGIRGEYGRGSSDKRGPLQSPYTNLATITSTTTESKTDFASQCTLIKNTFPDLRLITVAFEASSSAETLMANCASGSAGENAHIASESTLGQVFNAIAEQISDLRIER